MYAPMCCQTCGTGLQCMPGGGGLADFDCPKCYPEGFRPMGQSLEDWRAEQTRKQRVEAEARSQQKLDFAD